MEATGALTGVIFSSMEIASNQISSIDSVRTYFWKLKHISNVSTADVITDKLEILGHQTLKNSSADVVYQIV